MSHDANQHFGPEFQLIGNTRANRTRNKNQADRTENQSQPMNKVNTQSPHHNFKSGPSPKLSIDSTSRPNAASLKRMQYSQTV